MVDHDQEEEVVVVDQEEEVVDQEEEEVDQCRVTPGQVTLITWQCLMLVTR